MNAFFDNNATTPLDRRVLEAMLPYLSDIYGNPSSLHRQGRASRAAIEQGREQVADLVGAHPSQVVFTSGGTEGNNAVLKGVAWRSIGGRVAVSTIEHPSVLEAAESLTRLGWRVDRIPSGRDGRVSPDAVRAILTPETRLVSVMLANNETGVLQELNSIAEVVHGKALLHTDAVQAAGKISVDFAATGAQFMTLSAHKIHGPKGVGALIAEKGVGWEPLLHGGGQEKGRRGGTENLAGIVGFGAAAALAKSELAERAQHLRRLRDRFEMQLRAQLPEVVIFAGCSERLPNTVFMALPGIDGEALLMNMDREGFALSSGAACAAAAREPSHVLRAMDIEPEMARNAVRVSFGRENTPAQVDALVNALCRQQASLRASAW